MPQPKKADEDQDDAAIAAPKGKNPRTLVRTVIVGGVAYGPGLPAVLTPEVEAQITNPAAWEAE